jgi:hypothetical protein
MKTPYQISLINWLAKVTDDPLFQGAGPVNVIRICCHEDRRNGTPSLSQVSAELDPGHGRHVDISDQAGRFGETRGCEKIDGRRESFDAISQRPYEPSHGFARGVIVLDDREQCCSRHTVSGGSLEGALSARPITSSRSHADNRACVKKRRGGNARS